MHARVVRIEADGAPDERKRRVGVAGMALDQCRQQPAVERPRLLPDRDPPDLEVRAGGKLQPFEEVAPELAFQLLQRGGIDSPRSRRPAGP